MRRTKIIATLGPATDEPGVLKKLIVAGVDVFRLNYSHQSHAHHEKRMKEIRQLSLEHKHAVAVILSLNVISIVLAAALDILQSVASVPVTILPSVFLLTYSAVLSLIISLPLSYISSIKVNSYSDHIIRSVGLMGFAMPPFWVGILLILIFGLFLNLFPVSGYGEGFIGHIYHLFLPSLTIALFLSPRILYTSPKPL